MTSKPSNRLCVNVASATEAALRQFADREKVTLNEALQRLVAGGAVIYQAVEIDGAEVCTRDRCSGTVERLRLIC